MEGAFNTQKSTENSIQRVSYSLPGVISTQLEPLEQVSKPMPSVDTIPSNIDSKEKEIDYDSPVTLTNGELIKVYNFHNIKRNLAEYFELFDDIFEKFLIDKDSIPTEYLELKEIILNKELDKLTVEDKKNILFGDLNPRKVFLNALELDFNNFSSSLLQLIILKLEMSPSSEYIVHKIADGGGSKSGVYTLRTTKGENAQEQLSLVANLGSQTVRILKVPNHVSLDTEITDENDQFLQSKANTKKFLASIPSKLRNKYFVEESSELTQEGISLFNSSGKEIVNYYATSRASGRLFQDINFIDADFFSSYRNLACSNIELHRNNIVDPDAWMDQSISADGALTYFDLGMYTYFDENGELVRFEAVTFGTLNQPNVISMLSHFQSLMGNIKLNDDQSKINVDKSSEIYARTVGFLDKIGVDSIFNFYEGVGLRERFQKALQFSAIIKSMDQLVDLDDIILPASLMLEKIQTNNPNLLSKFGEIEGILFVDQLRKEVKRTIENLIKFGFMQETNQNNEMNIEEPSQIFLRLIAFIEKALIEADLKSETLQEIA